MDVSIIIVNYNTCKLLIDCINSIYKQTFLISFEIIIVDNASTDDSVTLVRKVFPNVIVIENKQNVGFGKANNIGSRYANGKYLFFLNSDTVLISNAVKILYETIENNSMQNIGICCGNLYNKNLTPNYSYSTKFPSLLSIFLYRSYLNILNETFNGTNENKIVLNVIGADLFISGNLFQYINGFDEAYFMYIEDADLSYRVYQEGLVAVSVPSAKIIHLQGKSSLTSFKIRNEFNGYCIYFLKHYGKVYKYAYMFMEIIFATIKFLSAFLILNFEKAKLYRESVCYMLKKIWK